MKVFLIILAVLVLIIALILSLTAEFTVVFEDGWTTRLKILFIEKDIELSKLLSFVIFPDKSGKDAAEKKKEDKKSESNSNKEKDEDGNKQKPANTDKKTSTNKDDKEDKSNDEQKKPNAIQKIYNEDGVVGVMLLASNLLQTAGSAINTLIKDLHIYSLYVKMIIGGSDAAEIGQFYGTMCGIYYPIKGMILNGMKVDQYDDYIKPDFIAPESEYGFQLICSISVGLLLKVVLKAGKVFLVNFIKNK